MNLIQKKIFSILNKQENYNSHYDCKELLNFHFTINKNEIINNVLFNIEQKRYALNKINEYKSKIDYVFNLLLKDNYTRQSILVLDTYCEYPNCMVSIHFQIRNNILYVSVYQRSLDIINKLPQDIEIIRLLINQLQNLIIVDNYNIDYYVGNIHFFKKDI